MIFNFFAIMSKHQCRIVHEQTWVLNDPFEYCCTSVNVVLSMISSLQTCHLAATQQGKKVCNVCPC